MNSNEKIMIYEKEKIKIREESKTNAEYEHRIKMLAEKLKL